MFYKNIIKDERGMALPLVFLVMLIVLSIGTTVLTISKTEMDISNNDSVAQKAFYIADAGISVAKNDINSGSVTDALYTKEISFGGGQIQIKYYPVVNNRRIVESTGVYDNISKTVSEEIYTFQYRHTSDVWTKTGQHLEPIIIGYNTKLVSDGFDTVPYPEIITELQVGMYSISNAASFETKGNNIVDANVYGPSNVDDFFAESKGTITGTKITLDVLNNNPIIDMSYYKSQKGLSSSVKINSEDDLVKLQGPDINGIFYYTGNLILSSDYLYTGAKTLFIDGDFDFDAINVSPLKDTDFLLLIVTGKIHGKKKGTLKAYMYCNTFDNQAHSNESGVLICNTFLPDADSTYDVFTFDSKIQTAASKNFSLFKLTSQTTKQVPKFKRVEDFNNPIWGSEAVDDYSYVPTQGSTVYTQSYYSKWKIVK